MFGISVKDKKRVEIAQEERKFLRTSKGYV
jgi:hypothetical protein